MKRLENKIAVITGGGSGIGRATALRFADEGAHVIIWDVADKKGEEAITALKDKGSNAAYYHVDTTDKEQIAKATEDVISRYGRIDILINNAGITKDSTLLKMTDEQWERVIDVNLNGVYHCTRAIAPIMAQNNYGRIINASSVVGLFGNFGQTNYAATKAGLIGMTQTLSKELGRKGITVNAVAPGFIATEMIQLMPEDVLAGMEAKVPVKRLGQPEEVAALYAFLASDEAAYINGAVIRIDGGIVL
ncbi:MAG: 3-oxoacyl-[acyl-carrier-protein] reductase [Saprospiraceae bacterium]|jgi:3-oxoacyl-[acyl-carrier protein] reductase|nr:3-oxoacyl-[acyl-carrier-protein] reductase [Candidatus Parvibacillus calidus]MBX2937744.1 3-oxoacyl-[acyl-carrier-protein] reductase [Saprospiraceae bacterium]MBX7178142.1 3-oxoacyl-[acyl-carrier-protein] reductase [Saprospiraceae bacterium]MCB0590505.1 3-oxoacyl-[acyl-carrier-protein] reductase [Saprospiraceae bacterium]MCO5282009.1 3-oxoacyl-[acyl-carrier-protein] reductase [Saprospiraceae bacterium]